MILYYLHNFYYLVQRICTDTYATMHSIIPGTHVLLHGIIIILLEEFCSYRVVTHTKVYSHSPGPLFLHCILVIATSRLILVSFCF